MLARAALLCFLLACAAGTRSAQPVPTRPIPKAPKDPASQSWLEGLKGRVGPVWVEAIQRAAGKNDPTGQLHSYKDRRTVVVFTVHRDGAITDVALGSSSGVPYIDEVALEAFRRLGRMAPPPAQLFLESEADSVELPFAFTLQAARHSLRDVSLLKSGVAMPADPQAMTRVAPGR